MKRVIIALLILIPILMLFGCESKMSDLEVKNPSKLVSIEVLASKVQVDIWEAKKKVIKK